ncbi:MAG: hypothetical protein ACRDRL_31430 [Sciscionella sp.]
MGWPSQAAYEARLFGCHDYTVAVELLTLEETVTGELTVTDGQVNIDRTADVWRICSLTVSDPDGALDFSAASDWSAASPWPNRLIRVRHHLSVAGTDVVATPFVGIPTTLSRSGAEVSVGAQDKSTLAARGSRPYTVRKGMWAVDAIRQIMSVCTGERHFRMPSVRRRLSRDYSVGWGDDASPWKVCKQIAWHELDRELLYACDGYLLLRKRPTQVALRIPHLTEQASDNIDFTAVDNIVRVEGRAGAAQPVTWDTAKGNLSPDALGRHGAPRYLPLLVTSDAYTKTSQTAHRATVELDRHARLEGTPQFSCVPFFHADADDLLAVAGTDRKVRVEQASIPLGASGEMTIGTLQWVSAPPAIHSKTRQIRRKHGGH